MLIAYALGSFITPYVIVPFFTPHSDLEVVINRIYSLVETNSSIVNPELILLSSFNDSHAIYLVKNVKNTTSLKKFELLFPADKECCKNKTHYLITIKNVGNAVANYIEIVGEYSSKPNISDKPANAIIYFGEGIHSNQFSININNLAMNDSTVIVMETNGLSSIEPKVYAENKMIPATANKIAVLDSVVAPYTSYFEMNGCPINVPKIRGLGYHLLQLKGSNVGGCNLYWESVYPAPSKF